MNLGQYRFSPNRDKEFARTLQKRVNNYFKEHNLSRNANAAMKLKTALTLGMYLVPFVVILFSGLEHTLLLFLLFIAMGLGKAAIGTSIMHDALHGSYSKNRRVNKLVGYVSYLIGVNALNWKIQHNVKHHSFTNIEEADEDLDPVYFLRFSPSQKKRWFHRYQHVYASVLYCFTAILWVVVKDISQMSAYIKEGFIEKGRLETIKLVAHKVIYFLIIVGLPMIFLDQPWWLILIMLFVMYATAGFILSSIFQLAHVMPNCEFIEPGQNEIDQNRLVHQLMTTSNFGMKSSLITWFSGGLNFQVEHHLFPNVCHVHYPKLSEIVKDTTREFGIPYNTAGSFGRAYRQHLKMLKQLGRG